MRISMASLFDGIGGWQLAAERAGIDVFWSSEIETFPRKLTEERFPRTTQFGDIRNICGYLMSPVDIITMGSPCQNLSISGNRKGLYGQESSLFMEGIRIAREMREESGRPGYLVWENVPGAFTTNKGMDFKTVLEEITESKIPMPRSGKWATAGMVRSPKCVVGWRTLDAQYWGVPQRRRRIFLVASYYRWRGEDVEEILFKPESLSRYIEESKTKQKDIAERNDVRPNEAGKSELVLNDQGGGVINVSNGIVNTLRAQEHGHQPIVFSAQSFSLYKRKNVLTTLRANGGNVSGGSENLYLNDNKILRRLTPLECERLQGLPDNYTFIRDKSCSDTARYKAIGNGMAQCCADFIMSRIVEVIRKNIGDNSDRPGNE